ncbi:hypothetical protein PISMIDRAFT_683720, partial [Pisolithus microcarpus 441]
NGDAFNSCCYEQWAQANFVTPYFLVIRHGISLFVELDLLTMILALQQSALVWWNCGRTLIMQVCIEIIGAENSRGCD